MDNDDKKEYLKSYGRIKKEIESIEASIQELRASKMAPGLILDDMPHSHNPSDLSDYAASLDELERELIDKKWEALSLHAEIEGNIIEVPDELERSLLRYRYIAGMKWEEICVKMGYSWKQVHRIHSSALVHFENMT